MTLIKFPPELHCPSTLVQNIYCHHHSTQITHLPA